MAHTHKCPNCSIRWECGEANYQDECGKPSLTLCLRCWSIQAGKSAGPKRSPKPELAGQEK